MKLFERFLTLWVALAIATGVLAGLIAPEAFASLATLEVAKINLPIAILIWFMILPMMMQIEWSAIRSVGRQPKGLMLTLLINWLIKPFSMLAVGIFFFEYVFVDWVEPASAESYLAGMILLGVAPCTAMVFVWSQLVRGDPNYTLVQVTINDLILIVAFAPIAGLLLGISDIPVPWDTLALSTLLYVVLPLLAGMGLRRWLIQHSEKRLNAAIASMRPLSIVSLLLTVTLLFGFQAKTMIDAPEVVVIIAIPLLVQTYGIFFLAWFLAARLSLPPSIAGPACLIGTSNFFELAVAVAIALFGLHSGAALATVVGVLVEVPVMLSLVWWVNRFQTRRASTVSRTS